MGAKPLTGEIHDADEVSKATLYQFHNPRREPTFGMRQVRKHRSWEGLAFIVACALVAAGIVLIG